MMLYREAFTDTYDQKTLGVWSVMWVKEMQIKAERCTKRIKGTVCGG